MLVILCSYTCIFTDMSYCRKILCGTITSQSFVGQIVKNFVGYILLPMAELALCLLFIESLNHAPISCKVRLNL